MAEFRCEICNKSFNDKRALEQHALAKHQKKEKEKRAIKLPIKKLFIFLAIILIVLGLSYLIYSLFSSQNIQIGTLGSTHEHADIAIYLKGERITPFPPRYYVKSPYIHVEAGPGAGYVIHIHARNVPLKMFFNSLGMSFDSNCFRLDNGVSYCNDGTNTLKFYIKHEGSDWERNYEFENYRPRDLDKILITYGNESEEEIKKQQDSVTDLARVESGYRSAGG